MILDEQGDDGNQDDHNHDADQSDQNGEMEVLPPPPLQSHFDMPRLKISEMMDCLQLKVAL